MTLHSLLSILCTWNWDLFFFLILFFRILFFRYFFSGYFFSWYFLSYILLLSHNSRLCSLWHVLPAKTQISLRVRTVWSEASLPAKVNLDRLPSKDYTEKTLNRLRECAGWSEYSLGTHVRMYVTFSHSAAPLLAIWFFYGAAHISIAWKTLSRV